jgi:ElaA protein
MSRFRLDHLATGGAETEEARAVLEDCHALRRLVFVEEQRVEAALEWDELDALAEHFLARRTEDGVAVGTARLRVVAGRAKAERVAVRADARQSGVGRFLMRALEERARAMGCDEVLLNAQLTALPFYEALGYVADGPIFEEAGIDHRAMRRGLSDE